MRPVTLLLLLFVVSGFAANAQFSLVPQIGVENPVTKMTYNDGAVYAPFDCQSFTQFPPPRADYKLKKAMVLFLELQPVELEGDIIFPALKWNRLIILQR